MNITKPTVLVTAIGTAASTAIVSALKDTGSFYIIGADIYRREQVATAKDVDEFYTFPPAVVDQENYIDFELSFCKKHGVSFCFATIDEEIANVSAHREKFEEAGIKLCIPNAFLIETCHYKDRFFRWIEENMPEIAVKTYRSEEDIDAYPLFIKPIEGRASIGCSKVKDKTHLDQLIKEGICLKDYVLQEFLDGEVVSVDMIRNASTGQKTQIQRVEEIRNSSGCGIAVQIIRDEHLSDICDELMEKLELNGIVNAEFFRKDGKYRIIEVNPRLSAGTSFTMLAGLNTPLNAIRIAAGEACVFGDITYGKHLAKRYETYVLD